MSDLGSNEFRDLDKLEIVGIYPNYATAYAAWKAKAQQTVDNAHMRYFIVHMHRLLDPETDTTRPRLDCLVIVRPVIGLVALQSFTGYGRDDERGRCQVWNGEARAVTVNTA